MKTKEFNNQINETIFKKIKEKIISEAEKSAKEVYHIKCEGVPLATFDTKEEAEEALPMYKDKNDGELIIEKAVYDSHEDMVEKLDQMNDELEEEEEPTEGNAFTKKLKDTPKGGKFKLGDKEFTDNSDLDEEDECNECGKKSMEEKLHGGQTKLDKDKDGKITKKDFLMMLKNKKKKEEDIEEGKGVCNECGSMLNEEGMCNECGDRKSIKESNKKVLRLTEKQMIDTIKKIVKESVPGEFVTKKMQGVSKKINQQNINDVSSKIKSSMSIPNNDNPEFPKQIGKGEKVARQNSKEEDEIVADNRGGTMIDLNYDNEPSENFKKRLKMALEGDALMGNSQEYANVVKSDVGEKLSKQIERKEKKRKEEPQVSWGIKWKEPVKTDSVNESEKGKLTNLFEEEIKRIKNISTYNKKTQ